MTVRLTGPARRDRRGLIAMMIAIRAERLRRARSEAGPDADQHGADQTETAAPSKRRRRWFGF